MRSPAELSFRLRQEALNLWYYLAKPKPPAGAAAATPFRQLPDPTTTANCLKGSPYAASVIAAASAMLAGQYRFLGLETEFGPDIHWRRDLLSGRETGSAYFRRIPYLDPAIAGDHKVVWEPNRHQHLVLLAQAFLLTKDRRYLAEIIRQLETWFAQNPFQCGINYTSALEVAFRSLSWLWIYHLCGPSLEPAFRDRLLTAIYQHGLHLDANLSVYFSPNTHLIGEAVALHAIGVLLPELPGAARWAAHAAAILSAGIHKQVRQDGVYFEQSTYYHVYALDMFLFHGLLAGVVATEAYRAKLGDMAEFLAAVLGRHGELPCFGDDDGGRFFHPFGPHAGYGRATLATCGIVLNRPDWIHSTDDFAEQAAWWLPQFPNAPARAAAREPKTSAFPHSGFYVMAAGDIQLIADAGPFGPWSAGHSHADTLHFTLRDGAEELLIDPATYTYIGDPAWRNLFRGTAMHNTVRVAGLDQADAKGPFGWLNPPQVAIEQWTSQSTHDLLIATCSHHGFTHRRRLLFVKSGAVLVLDEVEGSGEHAVEQFWHLGGSPRMISKECFAIGRRSWLLLPKGTMVEWSEGGEFGWRSAALGVKTASPCIRSMGTSALPVYRAAMIVFGDREPVAAEAIRGAFTIGGQQAREAFGPLEELFSR